jgi:hypothetical protein
VSFGITGINDEFWEIVMAKIESGVKVKMLLADPRSLATFRRSSQLDSSIINSSLLDMVTRLENHIGRYPLRRPFIALTVVGLRI